MRLAHALALLVLLAPVPRAGDESRTLSESGIEARVRSPWPASVHKGWAPIFVELHNGSGKERTIVLEASCSDWSGEREVRAAVDLAPGAGAALELLVPMGGDYNNQYTVEVRCAGETAWLGGVVGTSSAVPEVRQVLVLGDFEPEAGAVERWSARLSSEAVGASVSAMVSLPLGGTASFSSATTAVKPNDVDVAHARFDALPRHHGAYSSLDLVVLDTARGLPAEAALAPLVAWVRTGGDLLLLGEEAVSAAMAAPALAAWMEGRFEMSHEHGAAYRCGLGRLFVGDSSGELSDPPYVVWVREILDADASLTPEAGTWRGDALVPRIPGLAPLPYRAFAALLILFSIVIGPVNFFVTRRRKRPVLLLLTIPSIALVTTLALLAYGIFFQGVDVKTASHTVAVLDQREHRVACVESRELFAGLAPAPGLAPGPGTVVHDARPPDRRHVGGWNQRRFSVEPGDAFPLGGDYLPSRRRTWQVLAVERAERARLDVRRAGDGLEVDNNLGAEVENLIVRDPEGWFYLHEKRLGPGERAKLRRLQDSERASMLDAVLHTLALCLPLAEPLPAEDGVVPPGCYLARLATSPFRDDCGIETNEQAGSHVVLGVLALEPEAWR